VVETYRIFIAIELPRELRGRISQHINALRQDLPEVRASWPREENLHLTVKFLGDVPLADIPKLSTAIESVTRGL
jgi:2'-5' RNA ligase